MGSSSDRNFRADHQAKAEWGREVERLKLIHMPDFDGLIYDFRTMAERVNARLKDQFGARLLRVRGALKVKCHLMFGIVALAVDQIIRVVDPSTAPAQEKSPRSGCYARSSNEICRQEFFASLLPRLAFYTWRAPLDDRLLSPALPEKTRDRDAAGAIALE